MIVLDTNVFSEVLKPVPSSFVLDWLALQDRSEVFITAVTQAEVLYGLETMPAGKRRAQLQGAIEEMIDVEYSGRILPFDEHAARLFSRIVATRFAAGQPISQFDAMISAIARSHGYSVATRNISDFELCGIQLINPWTFKTPG